jgi:hypothetical protein
MGKFENHIRTLDDHELELLREILVFRPKLMEAFRIIFCIPGFALYCSKDDARLAKEEAWDVKCIDIERDRRYVLKKDEVAYTWDGKKITKGECK